MLIDQLRRLGYVVIPPREPIEDQEPEGVQVGVLPPFGEG